MSQDRYRAPESNRYYPKEGGIAASNSRYPLTSRDRERGGYFDRLYNGDFSRRHNPVPYYHTNHGNGRLSLDEGGEGGIGSWSSSDSVKPSASTRLLASVAEDASTEAENESSTKTVDAGWVVKDPRWYAKAKKDPDRGKWAGQTDFLMSMIAYAVGLGNVWRFPYLCYENGGGAFFVPYFICWLLAATPIFFMEVSIGQFLGQGGISVWKVCPIFRGVGWANQVIASMCNVYYCVIVAWALFYVLSSFSGTLPWDLCGHSWNDELCINETMPARLISSTGDNDTSHMLNPLDYLAYLSSLNLTYNDTQTPVEQFWEKRVLRTTSGIHETGTIRWELLVLLIAVWVFTYFALWKGITRARKMIYVCALAPYFLIFILLIRGATLPGAMNGVVYYLRPQIEKLRNPKVWKDAGTQIFYSFGIGFGTLIALGSYNDYNHNVYKDAVIMCLVNSLTSIIAGFVVFSVLGYMAFTTGKQVDDVVKGGVGLAFLVYPEAIITLPASQLWSVLFFVMIMILGLDSQICTVEGVITAMCDQFPILLHHKKAFVAVLCAFNCLLGLPMITQAGQYWLKLVDTFGSSGITLLFVMFFEVVGLSWGFGAHRILDGLEDMLGRRPCRLWYYCWKFTAPATALIIFTFIFAMYEPLKYSEKGHAYPDWAQGVGLLMSISSMILIPAYAVYFLVTTPGKSLLDKLKQGFTPTEDVKELLEQMQHRRAQEDLSVIEPARADCSKTCSRLSLSRLSIASPNRVVPAASRGNRRPSPAAPLADMCCEFDESTGEDYFNPRYSPFTYRRLRV